MPNTLRSLTLSLVAALSMVALTFAVAQETPTPGGSIVVAVPNDPVGLDPQKSAAGSTLTVTQLVYSSLLTYDADMNFRGDLAESWELVDDVTYVFRLREGLRWHNGDPLTAEDVKYSFERMLDPDTASPWLGIWSNALESVEVVDDLTVRFVTNAPFAPMLNYLSSPWYAAIVHEPTVTEFGDLQQNAMGSGPFMLTSYVPNSEVVLTRNPHYYVPEKPFLDEVVIRIIPTEASQLAALRAGTVNLMFSPDPFIDQRTRDIDRLQTFLPDSMSATPAWWFNQTEAPFDDVRVRRAFSLALDREQLIQSVLRGQGQISTKIAPSSPFGYRGDGSDLPYYTHDPDQARALLAEAGYPNGFATTVEIPNGFPVILRATEVMREQLAAVGIEMNIQTLEYGDGLTRCINTTQEGLCAIRHVWQPDPDTYIYPIYQSNSAINLGKWSDDLVDRLLEEGRVTVDVDARIDIYQQLERQVADQVYVIVPFAHDFIDLMVGDYEGYSPLVGGATPGTRSLMPLVNTWLRR